MSEQLSMLPASAAIGSPAVVEAAPALAALRALARAVGRRLVPWLVLFATTMFAWGAFRRQPLQAASSMPKWMLAVVQSCIAIYGGYFGGGIGFLMLAALTIAGQQIRAATATKNMLAMAMNASATLIFAFSGMISWPAALALCAGGIAGGLLGSWLIYRLPPQLMRIFVVIVGAVLTVYMFLR